MKNRWCGRWIRHRTLQVFFSFVSVCVSVWAIWQTNEALNLSRNEFAIRNRPYITHEGSSPLRNAEEGLYTLAIVIKNFSELPAIDVECTTLVHLDNLKGDPIKAPSIPCLAASSDTDIPIELKQDQYDALMAGYRVECTITYYGMPKNQQPYKTTFTVGPKTTGQYDLIYGNLNMK